MQQVRAFEFLSKRFPKILESEVVSTTFSTFAKGNGTTTKDGTIHRRLSIAQRDITLEETDAIVNPANSRLRHGGGLARIISSKGGPTINEVSRQIIQESGEVPTGGAVYAPPGDLVCGGLIHAVGPIYADYPAPESERLLRQAIRSIWGLSGSQGLTSVSIPAISSGIFGYPKQKCGEHILSELMELMLQEGIPSQDGDEEMERNSLEYVRITILDNETLDPFVEAFKRVFSPED